MNKHNTVKKNIIDFRRDGDFYFERAERFLAKGDDLSALENMRRAQKRAPGEDYYTFRIARIYGDMGLYSYSNDIYFRLISQKKCMLESYFGLTQNYMEEDNLDIAYHYLKCSYERQKDGGDLIADAENMGLDADSLYDVIEELEDRTFEDENRKGLKLVYDRDIYQKKLLMSANNLMGLQEFEKAVAAFAVIKPDSLYYCEALNGITLCHYLAGNYEFAKTVAEEAERLYPGDAFMLCNRLLIAKKLKEKADFEKYLGLLTDRDDMQDNESYRTAMVFCEVGYHGRAAEILEKVLSESPYDPQALLLCGQAHYNNGNAGRAAEMCRMILKIREDSGIAKYYLRLFSAPKKGKIYYACQVPRAEIIRRIKHLGETIKLPPDALSQAIDSDSELFALIQWTETLEDIPFQLVVFSACLRSGNKKILEYVKGLLLSCAVNSFLKKQLLVLMLNETKERQSVHMVVDDILTSARFNAPRQLEDFPPWFYESYVSVFATLSLMERGFEVKLNSAARELLKAAVSVKYILKDKKALAAVLNLIYGGRSLLKNKSVICEIYNTNMTTLRAYLKKLGLNL